MTKNSQSIIKSRLKFITVLFLAGMAFFLAACGGSQSQSVRVFAASSLSDVFESLETAFEAENPSIKIELQFAGSHNLVRQINEGAPADILATANDVVLADLDVSNSPRVFAMSELLIATRHNNPHNITQLKDLQNSDLLLGLCLPEVPCGNLAESIFDYLNLDIQADTYEPSARSTLAKLDLGELDVALLYKVDIVGNNQILGIPISEVPLEKRQNNYFLTLISSSPAAQQFQDFLFTPQAQAIFSQHSFDLPK